MKIRKRILILLIIPLLFLGLFIIFLNLPIQNFAEINIVDLNYQKTENGEVYLNSTIKVINKAYFSALINDIYVEVYHKNVKIGYSEYKEKFELQREKILHLTFKLDLEKIKEIIKEITELNETEIKYVAKASASINFLGFWFDRKVDMEGTLKLNFGFLYKIASWKIDINYIKVFDKNETNLFAKTEVNVINNSPFNIVINEGKIYILNDIGYLEIKEKIDLKNKEVKKLNLDLIININQNTIDLIQNLINEGKVNIIYKAQLNIFIKELNLSLNISVSNNTIYFAKSIKDLIKIEKIYIMKNEIKVLINLINEYGLDFILKNSEINLFYKYYKIGKIVFSNLKINSDVTNIEMSMEIDKNNLNKMINDFINNKLIIIEAKFNGILNILNKDLNISFNLSQEIRFEPLVDFQIIKVNRIDNNIYYAEVNITSSISKILIAEIMIKKAKFEIIYDDNLFGYGELIDSFNLISNSTVKAEFKIKALETLQKPITKIINGEELKINVRNLTLEFNLLNNDYFVSLNEINLKTSKINLKPVIKAEVNRVQFINSKEVEIEITAYVSLGEIPKLPINIKGGSADLYLNNNLITKIDLVLPTIVIDKSKNTFILKATVKKEISNLIEKFLNEKLVSFILRNVNISLEVLGENLNIEYNKDIEITLESPLRIEIEGIIENVSFANIEKYFDIKFQVSLNSSININNAKIIDINADIYLKNKFITKINLDLNILIQSNYLSIEKNVKIKLDESTFKEVIEEFLSNKSVKLSIRNIIANSILGNENYQIKLKEIVVIAKILYEINVYIPDFQIEYPGNKLTAEFYATIKGFNFGLMPDELILNAYSNNIKVAQIRLINVYNPNNYLMRGVLEAEFTQEGLNILATPLVQGKKIFLFVNNVKIKANINGLYLNAVLNFTNPILVVINHNFVLTYDVKILDLQNEYPGDIFPVKLLINYEYKNGVNIPITIKNARFDIYNDTKKLGEGYVKGDVLLTNKKDSIIVESKLKIYREYIGWFIEKFLFSDSFSITLDNIEIKAKAYNYEINVTLNKLVYTEKGPKVVFNVLRYSVSSITQAGIVIYADISFDNPYNITATITYLPTLDRTINFDIFESKKEKHPGLKLGYGYYNSEYQIIKMQKNIIENVKIVITNAAHLFLNHNYSQSPFSVYIKIYLDAIGRLGLKLYEVYTIVNFNINNIYIEFSANIL